MELGNHIQQVQPAISIGKLITYLFFKNIKIKKQREKKEKKEARMEDNLSETRHLTFDHLLKGSKFTPLLIRTSAKSRLLVY